MIDYKHFETGLETRTENVIVRLTRSEKNTLCIEAQKLGISISAFTRLLLYSWISGEITAKHKGE